MRICAGTINNWAECKVLRADVIQFLKENNLWPEQSEHFCRDCGKDVSTAKDSILFSIHGNIMAINKKGRKGGVIGENIVTGMKHKKWEYQRPEMVTESKDKTVRIYRLDYCKTCLIKHLKRIK